MKSKFTIKSYLTLILILAFIIFLFNFLPIFYNESYHEQTLLSQIFVPGLSIIAFMFFVLGEFRTKIIQFTLNDNEIIVKRFFGLISERYSALDFEGWKYSLLPSRGGSYEYLYLYKGNKKRVKLSEFYHKNYQDLKFNIQSNINV